MWFRYCQSLSDVFNLCCILLWVANNSQSIKFFNTLSKTAKHFKFQAKIDKVIDLSPPTLYHIWTKTSSGLSSEVSRV
jgi:hypothetical protein